ncbi:hypothetical protein F5Y17DRAFT_450189 [Xylariaceae sp. FL0594]|nr:hypothetical protein F5Y17DRAFT_450189 [Xylariaceae sp. FL0594]
MSLSALPHLPPDEQQAILNGPALEPPPGLTSNFSNPPNNNGLALAVTILCLSVSTILLVIRAYTRIFVIRVVRLEDAISLFAFGNYVAYVYCIVRFMRNVGFFVHQWDLQVKTISEFRYVLLIGANFYAVNILCIKVAIILEWLHVFVPGRTRNTFFWSCWAVLVVNTTYYIANVVALNLTCIPYQAAWDVLVAGKCLDQKALDTSSAAINLISDITLITLAQRVIWTLHMSLKQKLSVSLVFAAGIFGSVAGLLRLIVTVEYQKRQDTTYTVSAVILWAIGEMTAGFLVFCVPAMPKAIGSLGLQMKLASVRRYLLLSKPVQEDSAASASWKHSGPSKNRQQKHADGFPLTTIDSDVPLSSEAADELPRPYEAPPNAIIRTTQLVTTLHRDDENEVSQDRHVRQHPWVSPTQPNRWDPTNSR